jgi:LysM repeat protein/lipoprotein-anchoring transpeptidase ErfK/SrfK
MGSLAKSRRMEALILAALVCGSLVVPAVRLAEAANQTYVVQSGDTLWGIAGSHGVTVGDLAAANGLSLGDLLYVGQELVIPGGEATAVASTGAEGGGLPLGSDPRVPDPIPALPILALERPDPVVPLTYARVIRPNAAVYGHPSLASLSLPPKRNLGTGYIWVSVQGESIYNGQTWYQINPGEYMRAEDLWLYTPSSFHGVSLAAQPERPFAWILQTITPRLAPAGPTNPEAAAYGRYQLVQILAAEQVGDQIWYLIGPHQWVNQIYVGKVGPSPRPAGVAPGASWVDVNLFEQTMAVYAGDQMIYATLISSGLTGWDTPTGLTQVWHRVELGKMSGSEGRADYYFLEDVPWALYFNQAVSFHAAYWHNDFGYHHSHGCVNLSPLDARWLWEWAPHDLWVWVH